MKSILCNCVFFVVALASAVNGIGWTTALHRAQTLETEKADLAKELAGKSRELDEVREHCLKGVIDSPRLRGHSFSVTYSQREDGLDGDFIYSHSALCDCNFQDYIHLWQAVAVHVALFDLKEQLSKIGELSMPVADTLDEALANTAFRFYKAYEAETAPHSPPLPTAEATAAAVLKDMTVSFPNFPTMDAALSYTPRKGEAE